MVKKTDIVFEYPTILLSYFSHVKKKSKTASGSNMYEKYLKKTQVF